MKSYNELKDWDDLKKFNRDREIRKLRAFYIAMVISSLLWALIFVAIGQVKQRGKSWKSQKSVQSSEMR